jgi:NAD+ synthase (glutamine-hydrolysing)
MNHGYLKVASATPVIKVASCDYNADKIIEIIKSAHEQGVKLIVFPELCITGYTCHDLFFQKELIDKSIKALNKIVLECASVEIIAIVGLPVVCKEKLYNCGAVVYKGDILGIIPKTFLHSHGELFETRYFSSAQEINTTISINGKEYPFGKNILFECESMNSFKLAVEICEDLWVAESPSLKHTRAGATVVANLSTSSEFVGKDSYRKDLVKNQSKKNFCGYIFSDSGEGESTTDMVYSAHNIICETGKVLAESELFKNEMIITDLDLDLISSKRQKTTTFYLNDANLYQIVKFKMNITQNDLDRKIDKNPFIPDNADMPKRCELILNIQAYGLKKRIEHVNSKKLIIGVSGGLDSTLALLVAAKTMDLLNKSRKDILAVTMPCFGTSKRTLENAKKLIVEIGADFMEIDIKDTVLSHFKDINQNIDDHDVTYENAQARIRTLVLMDLANKHGGFVLGTGDLSELALGFATFGGDHLSMYNVNASVPKTIMRHIIDDEAKKYSKDLSDLLHDILDTPVSPELLPTEKGEISQKTENIVGPYELNDFFLYYVIHCGFSPDKIYRIAQHALGDVYSSKEILKWLKIFYKRFFAAQFKRSCMPDGPKVGSVCLSPRGDFRMPSDIDIHIWEENLNTLS